MHRRFFVADNTFCCICYDGLQVHVIYMQHKDLLLHYEQGLVK